MILPESGLTLYLTSDFMYRIFKVRDEDGNYIVVEKRADDFVQTAYREKITDGIIHINIKADKQKYEFSYAVGDGDMEYACKASTRFLTCELAGKCFTGALIGIYTHSLIATKAEAKYYIFKQHCN